MLGSITPLGERGRGQRWWLTVGAFTLGSVAGGLGIGAVLGGAGGLVPLSGPVRLASLAALGVAGLALDLRIGGLRLPGPRRQVNEDWLTRYRGWVYGASFGFQLGLGVVTVVSSSAVYLALAAALLTGSAGAGATIGAAFGLVRAAPVLALRGVRTPGRLLAVARGVRRLDGASRRLVVGAQVVLVLAAVALAAGL